MQDASNDVSAAHLASLPSMHKAFKVLQRAHAARQRILAGSPPVRVDSFRLYEDMTSLSRILAVYAYIGLATGWLSARVAATWQQNWKGGSTRLIGSLKVMRMRTPKVRLEGT